MVETMLPKEEREINFLRDTRGMIKAKKNLNEINGVVKKRSDEIDREIEEAKNIPVETDDNEKFREEILAILIEEKNELEQQLEAAEEDIKSEENFESRFENHKLTKKTDQERYNFFREFEDLEDDMINLVKELKENIEKGVYDILISDEISGRIPTLIIREVIRQLARENKDIKMPDTFFLNFGKGIIDEEALKKFISSLNPINKKALIVTECMDTFNSMANAVKALEKNDFFNFDIASARISGAHRYEHEDEITKKGRRIFCGHNSATSSPDLYSTSPILSGVEKETNGYKIIGIHPQRLDKLEKKSDEINWLRSNNNDRKPIINRKWTHEEVQKNINAARQDVKKLAKEIVWVVWGK